MKVVVVSTVKLNVAGFFNNNAAPGMQNAFLSGYLRRLWTSAVLKIESDFRREIEFGVRS